MAQELDLGNVKGGKGDRGESQYEAAVAGGYTGTEAEYCQAVAAMPAHMEDMDKHFTTADRVRLANAELKPVNTTATITATWEGASPPYTQEIAIAGVTTTNTVDIRLSSTASLQAAQQYSFLGLQDGGQAEGKITLKAIGALNTVEIPISVSIRGDG